MAGLRDYFEAEKEKHLSVARAIVEEADKKARDLSEEEDADFKAAMAKAAEFDAQIKAEEDRDTRKKAIDDLEQRINGGMTAEENVTAQTVGEAFVKSSPYIALKTRGFDGQYSTGPIRIPETIWSKANTGFVAFTEGNNADLYQIQREPGLRTPFEQRLTVADLLAQGQVSPGNNTIAYARENVTDSGAATVAEGGTKPPSNLEFKTETTTLVKIATTLTVSDEMLEDIVAIQSYLNTRLSTFVRQEEESQLLRGGGGSDISGILNHNIGDQAASDVGGDNLFDSILAAITYIEENTGLNPDAMVMHPRTFAQISVAKTATGGTYFSGGPYAGPAQNPWGLRTVITNAISVGHVLVGAFKEGGTVWRKGGLSVEATNGYQDYVARNLTLIRAEERVGLTIYNDNAFCIAREGS